MCHLVNMDMPCFIFDGLQLEANRPFINKLCPINHCYLLASKLVNVLPTTPVNILLSIPSDRAWEGYTM